MTDPRWSEVDRYINELLVPTDPSMDAALEASRRAGLPEIHVSPSQGRLLEIIARMQRATRVLEIGTLGGYSTLWLARSLPEGGWIVTIEAEPAHAAVARSNFARAGVSGVIDLREGEAASVLEQLAAESPALFDFVFIDADKAGIPGYFRQSLRLVRPGAAILVDNVVRKGAVADPNSSDPSVLGVRRFNELLRAELRVRATTIQTVGSKGYDGFTLVLVEERR